MGLSQMVSRKMNVSTFAIKAALAAAIFIGASAGIAEARGIGLARARADEGVGGARRVVRTGEPSEERIAGARSVGDTGRGAKEGIIVGSRVRRA